MLALTTVLTTADAELEPRALWTEKAMAFIIVDQIRAWCFFAAPLEVEFVVCEVAGARRQDAGGVGVVLFVGPDEGGEASEGAWEGEECAGLAREE